LVLLNRSLISVYYNYSAGSVINGKYNKYCRCLYLRGEEPVLNEEFVMCGLLLYETIIA
jgi:hypothetical protein